MVPAAGAGAGVEREEGSQERLDDLEYFDVSKVCCRAGEEDVGVLMDRVNQDAFPQRLQRLRERRKISRRVLSELCGLSKSAVSRYERGERMPGLDDAVQLADFFGVSLDYLVGREKIIS